jgi:hypothetical protein
MTVMQAHLACTDVKCTETRSFSPEQFLFKVRASLAVGGTLQVRVYFNGGHVDYAYQVFADVPLVRWDNKEDYPGIPTFPHHFHDSEGKVVESDLTGDPAVDIRAVLDRLANCLPLSEEAGGD